MLTLTDAIALVLPDQADLETRIDATITDAIQRNRWPATLHFVQAAQASRFTGVNRYTVQPDDLYARPEWWATTPTFDEPVILHTAQRYRVLGNWTVNVTRRDQRLEITIGCPSIGSPGWGNAAWGY